MMLWRSAVVLAAGVLSACANESLEFDQGTVQLRSSENYILKYNSQDMVFHRVGPPRGPIIEYQREPRIHHNDIKCRDYGEIAWLSSAKQNIVTCGDYEFHIIHQSNSMNYIADAYLSPSFCNEYPATCEDGRAKRVIFKIGVIGGKLVSYVRMNGEEVKYSYFVIN